MSDVRRVSVGRLTGAFGVRGEIKCLPTPFSAARMTAGKTYTLGEGADATNVSCTAVRKHQAKLLVTFENVVTPEAARDLSGREVFIDASDVVLGPGEFLDADLVGLRLIDAAQNVLGTVVGVAHFPAQDCLIVGERRALVPLIRAFVGTIDLASGTIATTLPDGLLD